MPAAARVPAVDLVVPIYNEEPIIGRLHAEVVAAMQATGCHWRVMG
jgi:hypothetical protein